MNLIFLGPPGAGKGTAASQLAVALGIPHISTGDIIRTAIFRQTPLGLEVKSLVESGQLVPDHLTNSLIKDRLSQSDAANGFILDGYPRTLEQAKNFAGWGKIDKVINFTLSDEAVIRRLSGRRVHKASGRTYHLIYHPPKEPGKDDLTGEPLWQRPDDQEATIIKRLQVYHQQTKPLYDFYNKQIGVIEIDAGQPAEQVYSQLLTIIQGA